MREKYIANELAKKYVANNLIPMNYLNPTLSYLTPTLSLFNVPNISTTNYGIDLIINKLEIQIKMQNELFSKHTEPDLEKANEILINNGWWFILSLPISSCIKLNEVESDVTPENLTKWIVDYHNKDNFKVLEEIVNKWDLKVFNENEEIFKEALWAHKKEKFVLTVPTLTIQVEGILRRYFESISARSVNKYRNELKKECENAINENKLGGMMKFVRLKNLEFIDNKLNEFYGSFNDTNPRQLDDIHRHPLLHGQYLKYGTIEFSTKLFLILDMMHFILSDLEENFKKTDP